MSKKTVLPALAMTLVALPAYAGNGEASTNPACGDPFAGERPRFDPSGWKTDFCRHEVPFSEFRSGGPPRDGIPPIDRPSFVDVGDADAWLEDREPVIALVMGTKARAYPLQVLMWHEVVNDEFAGTRILVTFCPLCYTALVFVRPVVDGEALTFGVSGNLRHSDMVMWDRATESWWQQFDGRAVVGRLTGTELKRLPSTIASWSSFRKRHPDGKVLSRRTGHKRPYGRNPYVGYDDVGRRPFMFDGKPDGRYPPMTRVVGVRIDGRSTAVTLDELKQKGVVNGRSGDTDLVFFWMAGTSSAVGGATVASGSDIGETAVFSRRVGGRSPNFEALGNGTFKDSQTGSTWDMTGLAVAGRMKGERLEAIPHHDTFWFVWSVFERGKTPQKQDDDGPGLDFGARRH